MKKVLIFTVSTIVGFSAFAKKQAVISPQKQSNSAAGASYHGAASFSKTTAAGDTIAMAHFSLADTPTLYYASSRDSGFVSGTDAYGDKGFAERYDFGTADSSLNVLGLIAIFGGKINPASTKSVTFYTWKAGARVSTSSSTIFNSGFPFTKLDSVTVPVTRLGIALSDTANDTLKQFYFTTPSGYQNGSFFVGYTINYSYASLGGDTLGVYTTRDGHRTSPIYTVSGTDTIINNQTVTMFNDGSWHDNATDNFAIANNYFMFPIVVVHRFLSVDGITNKNFTFFGNYPNPATTSTNVKFAVTNTTDVYITLMDVTGRVIRTTKEANVTAGEHIVNLDTKGLNAGDYTYIIRTTNGGGVASKITIVN